MDAARAVKALVIFIVVFLLVCIAIASWQVFMFLLIPIVISFVIMGLIQDPEDPPKID
jgi:hypothetical protein